MSLTAEQDAIVNDVDRDVVVTAGAGTGKTRVLVERYLALLESHRIGEIAAVTFTDAAAAEMRERVRREVMNRDDLKHHRKELDRAVIGTIHSLCLQILREHPVEAGMDPAAVVLSEDEAELELLRACAEALEASAQEGRGLVALQEMGVFEVGRALPEMVRRRDEVDQAYQSMPGVSPKQRAEGLHSLMDKGARSVVNEARPMLQEWVADLRLAYAEAGEDVQKERVGRVLDALGDPSTARWNELLQRVVEAKGEINLRGGSARNWGGNLAEVKELLGRLRHLAAQFQKLPQWNDHDGLALEVLVDLRELFAVACAWYQDYKDRLGGLDYLDLEIRARELLRGHDEIVERYRLRFKHLMVDELQDTNPAQIELLQLLRGAGGPKAFFVGDAKQSIYRFRGGDVRSFRRLQREVEQNGGLHRLTRSFRSHDPLVNGLNGLFGHVLGGAKEDYEASMEDMRGTGREAPSRPCMVVMRITDKTPDGERASEYQKRRVEADAVAGEVARLLQEAAPVWDAKLGKTRRVAPADIAILLRRLSNVHLFEQALENRGVSYRTMSGPGFFRRQEVLDLINLVRWLAAPDDAIALMGLLRSPMFMLDDETLLILRSQSPKGDMLESLKHPPSHVDEEARRFCRRAWDVLADLRKEAPYASVHVLVEHALARTGFEASWGALAGGEQALANIRKLVGMLRGLRGQSLDEAASYLRRRFEDAGAREGQAPLDDLDAVRLMTIHGAKGLEFSVVFVPECDANRRNSYDYVQWRREEGISATLSADVDQDNRRRRPGFYSYLVERDKVEEAAEYKRLFYVASTRAADMLYLSGAASKKGESWMAMAQQAAESGAWPGVEVRPPMPVDLKARAKRRRPPFVSPPQEADEEEFTSPLVGRPAVVPIRSSTPVTALERHEGFFGFVRNGTGLGLARGRLAHVAIEQWFTSGRRPCLKEIARRLDDGLSEEDVARLSGEVDAMLDWLDGSPLAKTLRREDTESYLEMPFSWDWDGMPVHGTIDLVYRSGQAWRVVDFKTDDVRGRHVNESASRYLSQLALYREAVKQATGETPEASLVFLRVGKIYTPPEDDLASALSDVRRGVESGWEAVGTLEIDEEE